MWNLRGKRFAVLFLLGFPLVLGGCFLFAPPPAPEKVVASDGEYLEYVLVSWAAAQRASAYEVFRALAEGGDYEKIGETPRTSFQDGEASPNVRYWYRVRARNQFGTSPLSQADSGYRLGAARPAAPTNVQASDGTFPDRIRVTWEAAIGASNYEVYRSDVPGAVFIRIAQVGTTSYEDRDVVIGSTYYYKVKACNSSGCSDFSEIDSGQAGAAAPAAPANVQASDGSYSDRVRVTWSAVSGAAWYEVHRAASRDGTYVSLGETKSTYYNDFEVTAGTTYWYKVRAWNVFGSGPFSEPDSGYASAGGGGGGGGGALGQVQGVSASDGTYPDKIRITWNALPRAQTYRIYSSPFGIDGTFTQIAEVPKGTTSYEDRRDTLAMCTEYWYAVSAWDDTLGEGPLSVPDSGYKGGTLQAVDARKVNTAVTPYDATKATVKLTWLPVKDAEELKAQYEVWFFDIGTYRWTVFESPTPSYEHQVEIGHTYRYKIRTVSKEYDCITPAPFSGEIQVVVACTPSPPTEVRAQRNPDNTVTVSWKAVSGAQSYQVFRSEAKDGKYGFVGETSGTTYDDRPPPPRTGKVYYKVKTCVACGCGGLSEAAEVTIP